MHQYARISPDREVVDHFTTAYEIDPATIRSYECGQMAVVRVVTDERPKLERGQSLVGPIEELTRDTLRRRWRVIPTTAEQEYAQKKKEASLPPMTRVVVHSLLDRVRVLEGKPPLTAEQFDNWLLGLAQSLESESK